MNLKQHFELLAQYNQWMNESLYLAAQSLSNEELNKDRGAFFTSILGTSNHNLVGDIIWLKRFATHPSCYQSLNQLQKWQTPLTLSETLYQEIDSLWHARSKTDEVILRFSQDIESDHLDHTLHYQNMAGEAQQKNFGMLVQHFFNHQTHHRGQITTLLSQCGVDVGITDLLALIPDEV